jgi:hypothetical protein
MLSISSSVWRIHAVGAVPPYARAVMERTIADVMVDDAERAALNDGWPDLTGASRSMAHRRSPRANFARASPRRLPPVVGSCCRRGVV